jgi:hypothetical protein
MLVRILAPVEIISIGLGLVALYCVPQFLMQSDPLQI